jgi:hypothetical protein
MNVFLDIMIFLIKKICMIIKINKMINKKIVNVNWIIKWKACISKKKRKIDAIIIVLMYNIYEALWN